jgi:Rhs element Vgr protein
MPDSRNIETPVTASVATYTIVSEGEPVSKEYQLASINVNKEINKIPTATIIFQDGNAAMQGFKISDGEEFIPGKNIEIKAGYRAQEETIFKGVVVRNTIKVRKNTSLLIIECRDKIFQAAINPISKYYKDEKDSSILDEILGTYSVEKEVTATKVKHKEMVQYEQTDWDFILLRAKQNGFFCIVSDGKVSIKAPKLSQDVAETVQFGSSLLDLDLEMDARVQPEQLKAVAWDYTEHQLMSVTANEPSGALNGNIGASDLAKKVTKKPLVIVQSSKMQEPELQQIADMLLLQARLSKIVGRAHFQGTAKVKPGVLLELKGVGKRFEGKVFISGVRHQLTKGDWTTDAQIGFHQDWFSTQKQANGIDISSIRGLQVGIVIQLQEDPLKEDRILVRVPQINDKEGGLWSRVATLDAGNNRGSFFRPEIGDEVIVGFMQGNPQYPIVLGMLNSSKNPAPFQAKDDNDEKGLVTRSEMKMIFNDKDKTFQIETPAGNQILLSEKDKSLTIKDQNGNKIVLDDKGISLDSSKDIKIKATGNVKIEGKKIDLKASLGLKADGGGGCEITAGNGITDIKGGLVKIN